MYSFKYIGGDYYALKDINISFNTNETICLVGENGSGKSTFSKLLLRIYDPTKGRILLDDIDLREYDITELRKIFLEYYFKIILNLLIPCITVSALEILIRLMIIKE